MAMIEGKIKVPMLGASSVTMTVKDVPVDVILVDTDDTFGPHIILQTPTMYIHLCMSREELVNVAAWINSNA